MSLRYALLALLTVEPMTGYDLHKQFEASVGHVWHAPDSQIYPELKRMEAAGLLEGEDILWGQRGTKRQYHITDAGLADFRQWMSQKLEYARTRDPAHLKAAYLEWASPQDARAHFSQHAAYHRQLREKWLQTVEDIRQGRSPMLARRLANSPCADHEAIIAFKEFTYEGLLDRAEAEINWATRGLALINRLYPAAEA